MDSTRSDVRQRLKQLIAKQIPGLHASRLAADEPLIDGPQVAIDSLDTLNLLVALETEFALDLATLDVTKDDFRSIETLAALVEQALGNTRRQGANT